ncbi:hypothetical protein [Halobaculum sp. EA56]|uniref:hypothetical protein n=1 Tax=Halobaculum sp. EA56 TaxID=3421648 RepID=UPI003EC121BB
MSRRVDSAARLAVAAAALASLPGIGLAHPGHPVATPSGPLAGLSPTGLGVGLAGAVLLTGALLLAREGVLTERARSAGVGVGAALLAVGVVAAFALP